MKQTIFMGIFITALLINATSFANTPWTQADKARLHHCYQTADNACVVREHRKWEALKVQSNGGFNVHRTMNLHASNDVDISRERSH